MWKIAKIFPPAAGFWNVLTPFLNVSAHFEVQIFFGLRPKKILSKTRGIIPRNSSDVMFIICTGQCCYFGFGEAGSGGGGGFKELS